jgi:hypothetical protein
MVMCIIDSLKVINKNRKGGFYGLSIPIKKAIPVNGIALSE